MINYTRFASIVVTLVATLLSSPVVAAEGGPLRLAVQPVLAPEQSRAVYQPLVDYLMQSTGITIELVTPLNFLTYWQKMRQGGSYDLLLDGAHFVDYRLQRLDHQMIAKVKDVVSYTLVTGPEVLVFDPNELVGRRIAVTPSPSQSAVRLFQLFPHPIRQPVVVSVTDSLKALEAVIQGDAEAAMVPSPLVGLYPSLNTVVTLEQMPHMGLTAAPSVTAKQRRAIQRALLITESSVEGAEMLGRVNLAGFEAAEKADYRGYAHLLEGVWGY